MKLILKSILMLSKEKLCVLAEEVDFIYDICIYHKGENIESATLKKDLEDNFTNLSKQLIAISEKIIDINKRIVSLLEYPKQDERELLIFIDFYQRKINHIIRELKLINAKTSQMFRDGYNQYIPKPTPGRMFSNINMTSQVEESLEKRLNTFWGDTENKEPKLSAQIIWEYEKSYKITSYSTKKEEINESNKYNIAFFRMSYWYFDLPYLIPALTHEISHIALKKNKEYKLHSDEIIENTIKNFSHKEELIFFKKNNIQIGFFEHIIEEVLADIFSLIHHGTSYVFTMAHELLGYYFSSTFKYDEKFKDLTIGPWVYNYKRDHAFIRLSILIKFHRFFTKEIKNDNINVHKELFSLHSKELDDIETLLDIIYCNEKLDITHLSIRDYYTEWHNHLPEFEELETFILAFTNIVQNELECKKDWFFSILELTKVKKIILSKNIKWSKLDKHLTFRDFNYQWIEFSKKFNEQNNPIFYQPIINDIEPINFKIPQFYNDLWENRFLILSKTNLVPHKSELRKKIHRKSINYFYQEKKLDLKNLKPYTLTFYKYKIDTGNQKSRNLKNYDATLGIYDRVKLIEEKTFIPAEPIEIDSKQKKYEKYTLKFSLMKILDDIKGKNTSDYLNIYIQMEIKKDLKSEDTYVKLEDKLNFLRKYFYSKVNLFGKVEIFKSLGPKDIIVNIRNVSIESIYQIKSRLADEFDRTFTTIWYDSSHENLYSIKSCHNYLFSTEIRLTSNFDLQIPKKLESYINACILVPGVMDYRIEWKSGTSLERIEDLYDAMIGKQMVSDIQTSFVKVIDNEELKKFFE